MHYDSTDPGAIIAPFLFSASVPTLSLLPSSARSWVPAQYGCPISPSSLTVLLHAFFRTVKRDPSAGRRGCLPCPFHAPPNRVPLFCVSVQDTQATHEYVSEAAAPHACPARNNPHMGWGALPRPVFECFSTYRPALSAEGPALAWSGRPRLGRAAAPCAGHGGKRQETLGDPGNGGRAGVVIQPHGAPPRRSGGRTTDTATRMWRWQGAARPSPTPTEGRGRGGCRRGPHFESRSPPPGEQSRAGKRGSSEGAGPPAGARARDHPKNNTGRPHRAPRRRRAHFLTDLCMHGPNAASPTKRMEWAVAASLSALDSLLPARRGRPQATRRAPRNPPHRTPVSGCGGPARGAGGGHRGPTGPTGPDSFGVAANNEQRMYVRGHSCRLGVKRGALRPAQRESASDHASCEVETERVSLRRPFRAILSLVPPGGAHGAVSSAGDHTSHSRLSTTHSCREPARTLGAHSLHAALILGCAGGQLRSDVHEPPPPAAKLRACPTGNPPTAPAAAGAHRRKQRHVRNQSGT